MRDKKNALTAWGSGKGQGTTNTIDDYIVPQNPPTCNPQTFAAGAPIYPTGFDLACLPPREALIHQSIIQQLRHPGDRRHEMIWRSLVYPARRTSRR